MKKLICVSDVEALLAEGQTMLCVDDNTIVTPSARDAANAANMTISCCAAPPPQANACAAPALCGGDLNADTIYRVLQTMLKSGVLDERLLAVNAVPYIHEKDPSGLKVVRGQTVAMEDFDTGNPANKVSFQEVVCKKESKMSAGFLTIDHSRFDWHLTYEEIDYVIEGTLQVTINGTTYTAKAGDVLFVPAGAKVEWASPDAAKLFFVTYPANWADLL